MQWKKVLISRVGARKAKNKEVSEKGLYIVRRADQLIPLTTVIELRFPITLHVPYFQSNFKMWYYTTNKNISKYVTQILIKMPGITLHTVNKISFDPIHHFTGTSRKFSAFFTGYEGAGLRTKNPFLVPKDNNATEAVEAKMVETEQTERAIFVSLGVTPRWLHCTAL